MGTPNGSRHAERAAAWLRQALDLELPAELLTLALTHRSYAYEHGGLPTNERLEFLGDSVLGLVVTDELYRSYPELPEGRLAKLRASVVNMASLAGVARALGPGGIGPHLLLGRGEETTGGREKDSILADALEAMIGAVHLGCGPERAAQLVHGLFDPLLAHAATRGAGLDWKTSLQELGAARGLGPPSYRVEDAGPDHAKTFTASVLLGGSVRGTGSGRTKKAAEQEAAEVAWQALAAQDADPAKAGPAASPAVGPTVAASAAGPTVPASSAAGSLAAASPAAGPLAAAPPAAGPATGSTRAAESPAAGG